MARKFVTVKMPTDELVYTNCAVVNSADFNANSVKHVEIKTGPAHMYVFSIKNHPSVDMGRIAFGMPQRKWAQLTLDQNLQVQPVQLGPNDYIGGITLEADFQSKKSVTNDPLNSDEMAREFSMSFSGQAFTVGMLLVFRYNEKKNDSLVSRTLALTVKHIESADFSTVSNGSGDDKQSKSVSIQCGQLLPNSAIIFDKVDGSALNLIGKCKGKAHYRAIINPEWDFSKMGIGGLDNEFSAIFRRAFASRVFPPEFIEQLGMKHVRGILLYGPPGTGKTLMARQIGKMLNAREPKIINGPQILDKYVGESEANIRKLFADAEEEWKRVGANSGLHIIIFDEIDAICKQRGATGSSSAVHDTVVNQLLSKMDGVDQLNNILVIGMTNRKDMIDDALLRPGRFEVQMMISLPDETGRVQILKIHTARMREYNKLAPDVNVAELAKLTKNFSGAEIEGLVRAAQSSAMNRLVKAGGKVEVDQDAIEKLMINRDDFMYALENDIKPAFGAADDILERYIGKTNIIPYNATVQHILEDGNLLIQQARAPDTRGLVSVLLEGPPNTGKTALAAQIAKESDFPYVKVISPEDMIGYTEMSKCQMIRKVFDDAYKSPLSVVLVDNIERLLDYAPVGPRYSNLVLQALLVLLKMQPTNKKCRLLILCTCSSKAVVEDLELASAFSTVLHVPPIMKGSDIMSVLTELSGAFSNDELHILQNKISHLSCMVGIKKLLDMIDLVKQTDEGYRVPKFLCKMEEEGGLEMT